MTDATLAEIKPRPVVMFAGTRDLDATGLVRKLVYELPPDAIVLHGGNGLVDEAVHRFARERGLVTGVFEANWRVHGKKGGPLRSIAAVELANRVVVIWNGKSPGSRRVRDHAEKLGRPLDEHVLTRAANNGSIPCR